MQIEQDPNAARIAGTTTPGKDGLRWIGKSLNRVEDPRFLKGEGRYVDDITLPNMLHAAIQHSPTLGGKATAFDDSAKSKAGVKDIINFGWGVAVVADNEWTARSVARDLKVTWDNGANANYNTDQMAKDYQAAIANTQGAIAKKTEIGRAHV